jgi:putative ABC transport system permease protein
MKTPRLATWLLLHSLPASERECVLGDCVEEYEAIAAAHGRWRADRWFRAQVARSVLFNLLRRPRHHTFTARLQRDGWIMTTSMDLKYALRQLWRTPEFSVPALLTLALGIGVVSAVFTVVQRVVLRPLPYPEPERLIRLWDRNEAAGLPRFSVSPGNYFDWARQNRTLEAIGAYREDAFTLATPNGAERVEGARVTASLLDVLRVQPLVGRPIQPAEDQPGAANVAVVTHRLASRLGDLASVVGLPVTLDAQPFTIVGVLPPDFLFPQQDQVEILVPYALNQAAPERDSHFLRVLGRVNRDADLERARSEFGLIATRLEAEYPRSNRGYTVAIETLHQATVGNVEQPLMMLLAAAALLLFVTAANVAGLLLARSAARETEFAVRAALGAGTRRLARQLITESLLLSIIGGVLGFAIGRLALNLLLAVNADALPRATEIAMDGTALAVIGGVCLVTGLTFGIVPLLARAGTPALRGRLAADRAVRGSNQPLRRVLVAVQIALSLSLAIGAGLLVRNLIALQQVDPGFSTTGVLTMELRPPAGRYAEPPARVELYEQILARFATLPGAEAAGAVHRLPLTGNSVYRLRVEGRAVLDSEQTPNVNYRAVAGDYFEALGIRLQRGRFFSAEEMWERGGAVVVNQAAVARYLPDGDPLSMRLVGPRGEPLQIIGIIEDVRETALEASAQPAIYFPYAAYPVPAMTLLIRSASAPAALARPAQHAVREVDPALALGQIRTVDDFLREVIAAPRFSTLLLGSFAVIALVLAAIGIYGVTAYAVARRRSEIGLRMALGARASDIFRSILAPGLRLAAAGSIAGIACAFLVARLLGGVVFGVNADQPLVYAGTTLLLFAIAAAATVLPARRAMRVDPVAALRQE